jgi:acyl-CoA thioesterase
MNKPTILFAVAILAATAPVAATAQETPAAQAPDPAELAEARAIMEIAFPTAERDETFGTMAGQFLDQFRGAIPADAVADPGLKAILDAYLDDLPARLMPMMRVHLPKIIEATAVAYTNEFSLQELEDIHAFARTETGRHYFSQSAKLVGDPAVAAANTAYMGDLQRLQKSLGEEFMKEAIAYLEAHPEVLEQLNASNAE